MKSLWLTCRQAASWAQCVQSRQEAACALLSTTLTSGTRPAAAFWRCNTDGGMPQLHGAAASAFPDARLNAPHTFCSSTPPVSPQRVLHQQAADQHWHTDSAGSLQHARNSTQQLHKRSRILSGPTSKVFRSAAEHWHLLPQRPALATVRHLHCNQHVQIPSGFMSEQQAASTGHSQHKVPGAQAGNTSKSKPLPAASKGDVFIDKARLTATGGDGGSGAVSYERVARGRRLAASGGDGAPGGDVILTASRDVMELRGVPRHVRGEAGGHGGRNGRRGATGQDKVLMVPLGTQVYEVVAAAAPEVASEHDMSDADDDMTDDDVVCERQSQASGLRQWSADERADRRSGTRPARYLTLLAELLEEGQQLVVAHGGEGGQGNAAVGSRGPNQPPADTATPGSRGTTRELLLELKLLADVGFVGMPNSGKSSLLSILTAARAKVGNYAFTTLHPQLGTLVFPEAAAPQLPGQPPALPYLTVADIPGLIQGAHENRGRGNTFLRHVERVRCLAYVIDLSGGQTGALVALPPAQQLQVLQAELRAYRAELLQLPAVIAANKVDACEDPRQALQELLSCTQHPIVPVSATRNAGLHKLKDVLRVVVQHQLGRKDV